MEIAEGAAVSFLSAFHCLVSRKLWQVESSVGGLSAVFYKATCCRETARHSSIQATAIISEWRAACCCLIGIWEHPAT